VATRWDFSSPLVGSVACFCEFIYCSVQLLGSVMLSGGSMGRIFVRTSLYLCQSARLGLAKLTGKGEGESRGQYCFYESMV